MSLSEAPSVKIKYNTPQEVSDEILGGAIQFCRETGYKQNVMMLTFFWSAFLFTARNPLEENGILPSTESCFISSLSKVFPKIKEDAEAKENINNIREHYWNQLSADFINLNTEDEISYLIKIADELNAKGNTGTTNPTAKEPDKIFARISSTINSSIYQILHDYDSGLTIRYRNIPDEIRFEQNLNKTEKGASKSAKAAKKESHLGMAWYKYLIYFGLVAGSIINILYSICYFTGTVYLSGTNGQVTADQVYSHFGTGLKIVDIMYGLFLIAFAILGFVLREKLANFESDSLKFVIIFYSLAAGAPLLYSILSALITSTSLTVQSILSAIVGVIMLLLNIKYFKKRAHLFTDEANEEKMIATTPEKQPQERKVKERSVPKKYCSRCGSLVDPELKVCTGCGRKYFKGIKITKYSLTVVLLSVLLTISIVFNIIQFYKIEEIDSQRIFSINQVDGLLSEISELENKVRINQDIVEFVDEFVVFVEDDGTNYYHKYECQKFVGNYFWAYNKDAAIGNGYKACPYCH